MLTDMEYVYTVYKERSFSRAAKKLYVSQSAVSYVIKKVESALGCALFDRTTIPFSITLEGEYYIRCVERILGIEAEMDAFFQDISQLKKGHLSIGTSSFYCLHYIAKMVKTFKQKYPDVQVEIHEGNAHELTRLLDENQVDLAFGAVFDSHPHLNNVFFENEHLILGVPKSFPINTSVEEYQISVEDVLTNRFLDEGVPSVPLEVFEDVPFVSLKEGNDMYKRCIHICQNAGFTPHLESLMDQFITAYYIASSGVGALMVRSTLLNTLIDQSELFYYKIGDPLAIRPICFAYKKKSYISQAIRAFLNVACKNDIGLHFESQ